MPGESVTRGGVGRVSRKRGEQMRKKETGRKDSKRQRPDPVGVMTHSSGWAHPETGQGRQEEEREQALSLGSEKRLMEMGGVSKSSFLPCFLADQDIIIEGAMLEALYDHIYH